jgi:transcriptional regulator with XRE-family HTH domain
VADVTVDAVLLGRAIAAARSEKGMKRRELANAARVSYPYLSELENGSKQGSTQKIGQIAEALGMTPSQLLARAESLALAESSGPEPDAVSAVVPSAGALGWTSAAASPANLMASAALASEAPMRSLRPIGRAAVGQEDVVVERVTRIIRAEIEQWLDAELEPVVRQHVREVMRPGG